MERSNDEIACDRMLEAEETCAKYLDLHDLQLTSLPSGIGKLTKLTRLNVSGNQLTSLPPEIGKLTALEYLTVDRHQLKSLPPEMDKLTALIELRVSAKAV